MVKAPSKLILIIVALISVLAMVFLNKYSNEKLTPKNEEQEEQEQQAAAAADAAKNKAPMASIKTPAPGSAKAATLATLGQDATLGSTSPSAPEVTIQWSWTPEVQADPSKVYDAISGIAAKMPNVRVHAVNTDEVSGVPSGIFVGGRQVTPAGPDGSITVNPPALTAALGKK